MRRLLVLVLVTLAYGAHAAAPCLDSENTLEKSACLNQAIRERDAKLEQLAVGIHARLSRMDAEAPMYQTATAFDKAQAAWKGYRESECDGRRMLWGAGTGAPTAHALCVIELSDARIEQLQGDRWPK